MLDEFLLRVNVVQDYIRIPTVASREHNDFKMFVDFF